MSPLMTLGVSQFLALCTKFLVSHCRISPVSPPLWFFGSLSLLFGVLFFVDGDILVPITCLSLTIIMGVLQFSFCSCSLPGHMVRATKMLADVKEHCSTILHGFSLFHIDISTHVFEHLRENLIHHCIVNLECITLVV